MRAMRLLVALLSTFLIVTLSAGPAPAKPRPERTWTGLAFDTCAAPSQRQMDVWLRTSPYLGVGVYIGGSMRACGQRNLTRGWVSRQSGSGWHLLPIWVGPQATCAHYAERISVTAAARQGAHEARAAVRAAKRLGLRKRTTLWYDIEYFPVSNVRCRRAALRFLSSWTRTLHRLHYRSGVYSSVSAAIAVLDDVRTRGRGSYAVPDRIWFAWANGRADKVIDRRWVRSKAWRQHKRVHQFRLGHPEQYGGVRITIDSNFVSLGRRPHGVAQGARCGGKASRGHYPHLQRGDRGRAVRAARCLLGAQGRPGYDQQLHRRVERFQRKHALPVSGHLGWRTWTALLARGTHPLVKRGSAGPAVRRVQRALNAALARGPQISGHYGATTAEAVRRYQRRIGQPATGVVTRRTWQALKHGKVSHHRKQRPQRRAFA